MTSSQQQSMPSLRQIIDALLAGRDLTVAEARALLVALTDTEVDPVVKGAALGAMRVKGEAPEEVRGMALAMRELASQLPGEPIDKLVDTCGTGGDGSGSLNISTATALVVAGCGLRVAKHGNRSVSSKSGSADVLEALGMKMPESPEAARDQLVSTGFTFLFAPLFHGSMKGVAPVRKAIGARTVFNVLGPLTNPARPKHQLVGAFSPDTARLMADALSGMGGERAFVVHGEPGWDEATPCGPFLRLDVTDGLVREETVDPLHVGIERCSPADLEGGDPAENARRLEAVVSGDEKGAHRDAVLLNAGLVLEVAGEASNLAEGIEKARAAVDAGRGAEVIRSIRATEVLG